MTFTGGPRPGLGIFPAPCPLDELTAFFPSRVPCPLLSELCSRERSGSCSLPEPLRACGPRARNHPSPTPLIGLVDHSGPRLSRPGSPGPVLPAQGPQGPHRLGFASRPLSAFSPLSPWGRRGPHPAFRMPVAMTTCCQAEAHGSGGSLLRALSRRPG